MIKLYQFERTWGIPNLSPFCCKIETYLRMAGIEYDIKSVLPFSAPKGKLPFIEDNNEALVIPILSLLISNQPIKIWTKHLMIQNGQYR